MAASCSDPGAGPSGARACHYSPRGMLFWDSWYLPHEGKVHAFHLQVKRPESSRPDEDQYSIGHAVSDDLLHWEELPVALRRGPEGSLDCGPLFTGCTVWHEGTWYLFYTGNGPSARPPWVETICLATSTDGIVFAKHPANPLISADGITWKVEDVRDIMVRPDPAGRGWMGIVVMRLKDLPARESIRWVLFRSDDLVHWRMDRVVFAMPGRFDIFEVPDFFPLGDRWYVIVHNGDGSGTWSDAGIFMGTPVGQADRPEGPYVEVRDNLLHKSNDYQGFSARTLEWKGERLMLYGRNEGIGKQGFVFGRMSWPVKLVPRSGGGLLPVYWQGCDRALTHLRRYPDASLRSGGAWSVQRLGADPVDLSFMVSATIELRGAASAGIALSGTCAGDGGDPPAYAALLDAGEGAVLLTYPSGRQRILWPIRKAGTHRVRLVVVREMAELYVDEELVINCFTAILPTGGVGLCAAGGEARFSHIEYRGEGVVGRP